MQGLAEENPVVYVIDDDPSVRRALEDILDSVGLAVRAYASVTDFLAGKQEERPSCLVLDVRMPGKSGLEFQREMADLGIRLPVIFITGHGDIPMTVSAMKAGAIEFLAKPFREQELLDAIQLGIGKDRARRADDAEMAELQRRFESLTSRERQVMELVVTGILNKQVAAKLGVSEVTVKACRGQALRKMQVKSLADLVRVSERLNAAGRPLR